MQMHALCKFQSHQFLFIQLVREQRHSHVHYLYTHALYWLKQQCDVFKTAARLYVSTQTQDSFIATGLNPLVAGGLNTEALSLLTITTRKLVTSCCRCKPASVHLVPDPESYMLDME